MPFARTDRLTFHYREQGAGDGLPLLLAHGNFGSSRWWAPLMALLPDDIHVVAPDLRGCGLSDKPEDGYSVEEQAADLAAFLDALGWRDFDLAAHASSGALAMELALTRPGLLRALILIDSAPIEGVHTPLDALMVLEQMKRDRALLEQALHLLMPTFDRTEAANGAFFAQLADDAAQMAPAAFTAVAESLGRWNRFAQARQLTLPTLLIWGDQDGLVGREAMMRTLVAIPGANNLEVLHGVGHSPMIEAPLTLAEKIVAFLAEDDAGFEAVRASAYGQGEG